MITFYIVYLASFFIPIAEGTLRISSENLRLRTLNLNNLIKFVFIFCYQTLAISKCNFLHILNKKSQ